MIPDQDSMYDTVVEHSLPLDQFDDFLSEKVRVTYTYPEHGLRSEQGAFSRPELPDGVTQLAGFRLMLADISLSCMFMLISKPTTKCIL